MDEKLPGIIEQAERSSQGHLELIVSLLQSLLPELVEPFECIL